MKKWIVFSLVTLFAAGSVYAAPLAYDGFSTADYTAGALEGQSGGTGIWTGYWTNKVNNGSGLEARADSMEWTSASNQQLDTTAGSAWNENDNTFASRNARYSRDINLPQPNDGDALWTSFLMQWDYTENANVYIGFGLDSHDGTPSANQGYGLLAVENDTTTLDADQLGLRLANLNLYSTPSVSSRTSEAALYIVKWVYSASGNETITLWRNPADLSSEAGLGTAVLTGERNMNVPDRVTLWREKGVYEVDEFRLGSTLADVVPYTVIPEPGTLALFGVATVLLATWRRRG